MSHKSLPLPERFENDTAKTKGLLGGNRSSKTEHGAKYIIRKAISNPKFRIWCCATDFGASRDIQQRKIWRLIPKNEIKYGFYDEVNGFANRKLILKNGSIVIFKSYDQGVESFAQDDIDLVWNDEEPPYDIYREQRMRLLDRDGEMIFTMTSTKGMTELMTELFEDHDVVESKFCYNLNRELPRIVEKNGMRLYLLWSTENPYIDQDRVRQEMLLMSQQEILARIFGIPTTLIGKIFPQYNKRVHLRSLDEVPNDVKLMMVLDPHDRKPWAMQWIVIHKTGTAYCIDEFPNRNFNEILSDDRTYDEYADVIRQKEDALFDIYGKQTYKRIIDPNFGNKAIRKAERQDYKAHTTIKQEMDKRGFNFADAIDALEEGHLKVREKLHYEVKDEQIIKQPAFLITDNCFNTITHLSRYSRKDIMMADGDVRDNAKPQEKYKDFSDCTRYFWMSDPKFIEALEEFVPDQRKVY